MTRQYTEQYQTTHTEPWVHRLEIEIEIICQLLGFVLGTFCSGLISDRFGRKICIWVASVTMVVFGLITSIAPWYWMFVFTWWITGTMAISCYTGNASMIFVFVLFKFVIFSCLLSTETAFNIPAAFVWAMEICAGKWKIYLGMSMNYAWPTCR